MLGHSADALTIARLHDAIARLDLGLAGATVLTEAASGPYAVTPILAALAGASRVYARTRHTRYGTVEQVTAQTLALAQAAGCAQRIQVLGELPAQAVTEADIVTNSGHLRPIDAALIAHLKPGAVLPLMYEAWEVRAEDVDLAACRARGIPCAGTNEEHPAVGVFNYLGMMVIKQLLACRVEVWGSRILLLCDNRFEPHIERALRGCGAEVETSAGAIPDAALRYDAVVVAMTPRPADIVGGPAAVVPAGRLDALCPGGPVIQFWGDIDRAALDEAGIAYHPSSAPARGHMGGLLSDLGPMPVIRLQAGGLKVGEVLWREMRRSGDPGAAVRAAVASGLGQAPIGWEAL